MKPHVLVIHSWFGTFCEVIGPFPSKEDAEAWMWDYTQWKTYTVSVEPLADPIEVRWENKLVDKEGNTISTEEFRKHVVREILWGMERRKRPPQKSHKKNTKRP